MLTFVKTFILLHILPAHVDERGFVPWCNPLTPE